MIRNTNRRLVLEYIVNNPPHLPGGFSQTTATYQGHHFQYCAGTFRPKPDSGNRKCKNRHGPETYSAGISQALRLCPCHRRASPADYYSNHRFKGENCQVTEYPFSSDKNLLPLLEEIIAGHIENCRDTSYGIVGIAIGIYGVVQENQIVFTPYYPLPDPHLGLLLSEKFNIPVLVENESNFSVLGESAFHYGYENMIHINIHDGIGMGILINEELYKGHDGYAGELGHTILFPEGKPCACGNEGCLEQYASERAILEEYACRTGRETVTAEEFLEDYQQKLPETKEMMDLFVKYMAIGINNVVNTFNTDLIVLNSFFSNCIPDINRRIVEYLSRHQNRDCKIIPSRLQDISCLIGGIRVCTEHFLDIRHLQIQTLSPDLENS